MHWTQAQIAESTPCMGRYELLRYRPSPTPRRPPAHMTLRRDDLNLLPLLDALLRHRNVTRAGQGLGLSQSATTHALTRVSDLLNDPILVQSGSKM